MHGRLISATYSLLNMLADSNNSDLSLSVCSQHVPTSKLFRLVEWELFLRVGGLGIFFMNLSQFPNTWASYDW